MLGGFGVLPSIWGQVKEDEASWAVWLTALAFLGLSAEGLNFIGKANLNSGWLLFGGLAAWAVGMRTPSASGAAAGRSGWASSVS